MKKRLKYLFVKTLRKFIIFFSCFLIATVSCILPASASGSSDHVELYSESTSLWVYAATEFGWCMTNGIVEPMGFNSNVQKFGSSTGAMAEVNVLNVSTHDQYAVLKVRIPMKFYNNGNTNGKFQFYLNTVGGYFQASQWGLFYSQLYNADTGSILADFDTSQANPCITIDGKLMGSSKNLYLDVLVLAEFASMDMFEYQIFNYSYTYDPLTSPSYSEPDTTITDDYTAAEQELQNQTTQQGTNAFDSAAADFANGLIENQVGMSAVQVMFNDFFTGKNYYIAIVCLLLGVLPLIARLVPRGK